MSWDWEKLKEQQNQQRNRHSPPPNVEELVKKVKGFKLPGGSFAIVIIIAVLLAYSMFYTIGVDEVGIVQRFGKYVRKTYPGFNVKLPDGIEKLTKVKVTYVFKEEFGFKSTRADRKSLLTETDDEAVSLMLTGDLNVAVAPWIVQYKVKEPYDYLFKVQNVRNLLIDMSEATMRIVVGDRSINEVISKREEIAEEAKKYLQNEMNEAGAGIEIITIEMKRTNVPEPVQPSFNEVNQAIQEKEKSVYQAKEEYNKAIPTARGEAERTIRGAEGYALDRINRAKGEAVRFTALYNEYIKAKDVTRKRLYLETMRDIVPKMGSKYFIDEGQKGFLPLLNLEKQTGGGTK
ncbi:MAG: FtsH protease activity modulator HflK [Desulfobacterales bacterium]|nr:FtsH protease activity modulator HflK [Desulfobacterales bacterium]